ncbi:hypothetical protein SCP_0213280 [Sparassis crispa]|uniref:Ras-GAP domain-containing protein n=1 Tax=Sparassis crispa TaxID=139825 RepID=A0A401GDA8_9APHY|nr:hypothetical protein SCP_0213280 [Sparassis crispa]GBE80125.1 hypothetical protein SCP_0213280 [Sparassis crispa]
MPPRRASAAHNVASSSTRAHRSNGSNHSISGQSPVVQSQNLPYSSNSIPATPQQKVVYVLVNRLKNKLPCNSGITLTELETDEATQEVVESLVELSRESLDIIAWALSELLEKLAKQIDPDNFRNLDVLQSQLFVLKVLSIAMASRWNRRPEANRPDSRNSQQPSLATSRTCVPDSPVQARSRDKESYDHLSSLRVEPPPLDDNCAKYVLSVMVLFLRQTAPPKYRLMSSASLNFVASYHDFESIELPEVEPSTDVFANSASTPPSISPFPRSMIRAKHSSSTTLNSPPSTISSAYISKHSLVYETTSLVTSKAMGSLNALITRFVGRVVYHLSASNWPIVLTRIRNKIHSLANTTEIDPDVIDLQLMTHSALDKVRLTQALYELSSLLVNMKREAQMAIAIPLRGAIWNWIELFPEEFNETICRHRRLDGGPERVFDILYETWDVVKDKMNQNICPTLTALMCISNDRVRVDYTTNSVGMPLSSMYNRKDKNFVDVMIRNLLVETKISDVALICVLDICRAASRLNPEDGSETPLFSMASDIAHHLKGQLLQWGSQKPFWEDPDEIDVALISDILVTIYRFLPLEDTLPIFGLCLEPERAYAVKISVVKACTTLVIEASRIPWQKPLDQLKAVVIPRLPIIYKVCASRRSETDPQGNMKKIAVRPKAKRYTSETLPDRELIVFSILALYRTDPMFWIESLTMDQEPHWIPEGLDLWRTPRDLTHKLCMARTFRRLVDAVVNMTPENVYFEVASAWLKSTAPAVLAALGMNLIDTRTDLQSQRMFISMAYEIMYRFSSSTKEHIEPIQMCTDRVPAFAIAEIAFLVSLTSADSYVTLTAAHCLRLLARAETMPKAPAPAAENEEERVKRYTLYEQLGDPSVIAVGRIGHQKRVRKIMRSMTFSSAINTAVWEECFWRWHALHDLVQRTTRELERCDPNMRPIGDNSLTLEECQAQWQNLTLFMTAFGSACIRDGHDPSALTTTIPSYYLPDQMRVLRDPADLLSSFLTVLIDLLISDTVQHREVAREALSTEVHPRLYTRVFKELDSVLRQISGEKLHWESLAVFLDQFTAILRVLVENVQNVEEMRGIDIGSTLLILAGFITRLHDPSSSRIKIKYCGLCESVFKQAETIIIRKDTDTRQNVVDIVIDWIQDPSLIEAPDLAATQRELNMTAFKTVVNLLDCLQLQAPPGTSGEEATHVISRLFIRYLNFLLKVVESSRTNYIVGDDGLSDKASSLSQMRATQQEDQLRDLVLTGITSLISANTECGVKHFLPLAYDKDNAKRVLFANVFTRVLGQGIELSAENTQPVVNRQSRLCELIKGPDMILALAICQICPSGEVDNLISVLLNLFDTRSSLMTLMKMMIDLEVANTDSDTALFRGNSTCTRFLSAFASIYGYNYLRSIVMPLLKTMSSLPAGHGYDLDPLKVGEQAAVQNSENVKLVVTSFLQIISSSVPTIPSMFREICAHIAKAVQEVWPEAKFAAIGSFMFLRFISPAIVSPETVDIEVPKENKVIRRGLMIIAKVMQSLANNIFFGKEPHMISLNKFLEDNIMNVTRFLSEVRIYNPTPPDEESDEWLNTTYDDTDTIVLHRILEKHADKVGKELLSLSKPPPDQQLTPEGEASTANGKRLWDALCAALLELGQPLESPQVTESTSHAHREYLDLMSRYDYKDTTSVQDLFVKALTPQDTAVFVLSVSKIDVEVLDIELLLYHIFKSLTSPLNDIRDFDIVFDFTCFTAASQIPAQWLKFAHEVIPADIRKRFKTSHILAPNTLALKYLRRLYNLASGAPLSKEYSTHCSLEELLQKYPPGTYMSSLSYAGDLEQEHRTPFTEVTMRHTHPMREPVTLIVATNHLRVTTMKAQPICNSLACKATEIVPLSDINDVYNVATGHESNEFIIRRVRHGVTLYFSSPLRGAVVQAIRTAKGSAQPLQLPGAERFSRLSNIVITLLHIGMMSMSSEDEELHMAAYHLLSAVCTYLDYEGKPLLPSKTVIVNGPPGPFLVQLNEGLAGFAPQLTLDFISETVSGLNKASTVQRVNCLHYISAWIRNMHYFTNPASKYYEQSGAKFRDCVRVLIELTLAEQELHYLVQKYIWLEFAKYDSSVVYPVLDELMRAAVDGGIGSSRGEIVAKTLGAFPSIHVRARLSNRLRKVVGKTSTKPTKNLADNAHWSELVCLCRLALVVSYQSRNAASSQVFVPDTLYVSSIMAATGSTYVRETIYGVLVNMLNSLYTARLSNNTASPEIQSLLHECEQPETLRLFGLVRHTPSSDLYSIDPPNERIFIDTLESMMRFLLRILETISDSNDISNTWRARWMSLVTSSAFQLSPAVQTRAFISLGVLANSDVDDDLLYQMLVAFKTALSQSNETDITCVVSMLRCIRNVVPALPRNSRYICQLFWLSVSLLQSSHIGLYVEAIHLLRITLEVMAVQGAFEENGVSAVLLDGRAPLEEIACQLDQLLGLSFESSFSFSLASIIFKGIRHSGLKDAAEAALRSLLRITATTCGEAEHADDGPNTPICQEVLGYFLALIPISTTKTSFRQLVDDSNLDLSWVSEEPSPSLNEEEEPFVKIPFEMLGLMDSNTALFVTSFVGAVLTTAQGDDVESQILYNLLSDVGDAFPNIASLTYDSLQDKIKDAFANSSSPAILSSVSNFFQVAMQDTEKGTLVRGSGSASTLSTVDESTVHGPGRGHLYALEELNMQGLANSFQFLPPNRGHATKMINWISELVVKIIE